MTAETTVETANHVVHEIEREQWNLPGVHTMKPFQVFSGGATPRFLAFLAVFPVLMFMVGLPLFLWPAVPYPYFLLQLWIVIFIPTPILCWFIAVGWHTRTVYVWRRYGGKAILSQEPWRFIDTLVLPAKAWVTAGRSQNMVGLSDAMCEGINLGAEFPVRNSVGHEFDPRGEPVSTISDETVSSFLQINAATTVYSARPNKDKFRSIKMGFMFAVVAFVPFVTWLAVSSLTKEVPVP